MSKGGDHTNSRKLNIIIWLMILCLTAFPVSVFAAADTEVKIPVSVVLKEQGTSESVTTEILLEGEGEVPAPTKHSIRIKGTGKGNFRGIHFTAPGIYEYRIYQNSGNNPKVQYDKRIYYLRITVINSEEGGLEASVATYTDSRREGKKSEIHFVNTYEREITPSPTSSVKTVNSANPSVKTVKRTSVQAVNTSTKPKTGDVTPIMLWIGLLGAASIVLIVLYIIFVKKQNKNR